MFAIPKKKTSVKFPETKKLKTSSVKKIKKAKWDVVLSEDNLLVLDRPRFRINGKAWKNPKDILKIDKEAKETLGLQPRGGQMVQPWAREKKSNPPNALVELEYSFNMEFMPSGSTHLAVEMPETFEITLNGTPINSDVNVGWWCDKSLKKLPINPSLLKPGENNLLLKCKYDENHPGFEIIYLMGSFGVKKKQGSYAISSEVNSIETGDWTKQGLPFYSGAVSYKAKITANPGKGERSILKLPAYRGTLAKVYVNGNCAGSVAWDPNELDISDFLKKGSNDLTIEIISHRRNSHGPLHYAEKWPSWTGPGQYQSEGKNWTDNYQLVPCGLMEDPELIIKK
jgi:hypothetical protein